MTASLTARVLDTLRETGLRGVWFKLLAELGYRRLYLLRRGLEEPIPVGPLPPVTVSWLTREAVSEYVAMLPTEDADIFEDRLAVGDRCLVAWREGCIVGSMWGSKTRAASTWLDRELPLGVKEACLFDAYTVPRCRGLGIAPALSLAWLRVLREEGCAAAIILTLPENVAALRAYAKAGYRIVAIVRSLRLGPWLHDFPVDLPPLNEAISGATILGAATKGGQEMSRGKPEQAEQIIPKLREVEVGRDHRLADPEPLEALLRAVGGTSDMDEIQRYGNSQRWADVVIHRGVAYWVEVAEDTSLDARGQIAQVLVQIDATLETIRSDRTRLLQVLVYIADQSDAATLNELWDSWVPAGHPPVRAMVQVGLGRACKVEMIVTAAVSDA